jgi:hypothetical protein
MKATLEERTSLTARHPQRADLSVQRIQFQVHRARQRQGDSVNSERSSDYMHVNIIRNAVSVLDAVR